MEILATVQSALEALIEFFKWQTRLTEIRARREVYDIDQQQLAKGRELLAKIDAARNANDLTAVSVYLDDQANAAEFTARIRSAVSDGLQGPSMGVGSGVSTPSASGSGLDHGIKPAPGTESGSAVIDGPAPPSPFAQESAVMRPTGLIPIGIVPSHIIPKPPFSVTGLGTWFGWNPASKAHPEGTDDTGDMDSKGHDLKGAFGDDTHGRDKVFISIPIPIFRATIGSGDAVYADVRKGRWLFDVYCHATGKHVTAVHLGDLGPNERLNRPLDMTAGLAIMLGLNDNAICTWWVTDTHTGQILEVKGWDHVNGKVIS